MEGLRCTRSNDNSKIFKIGRQHIVQGDDLLDKGLSWYADSLPFSVAISSTNTREIFLVSNWYGEVFEQSFTNGVKNELFICRS